MIKNIDFLTNPTEEECCCEHQLAYINTTYSDGRKIHLCRLCNRTYVIGNSKIEEVKRDAGDKQWHLTGYVRNCTIFN